MSRLSSISDSTGTVAAYKYLGAGRIVEEDGIAAKLTYLDSSGNVTGLDRFGRVVDQLWENYDATPTAFDHYHYGYDRAGNRVWKQNLEPGATALDELYAYDAVDRLVNMQRGELDFTDPANPHIDTPTLTQTWTLDSLGNNRSTALGASYNLANASEKGVRTIFLLPSVLVRFVDFA